LYCDAETCVFCLLSSDTSFNPMTTFTNTYDEKIRPLMDKIDHARTLLAPGNYGITFPNVIVVGDQSSGKSSLLESLSLVELPKGNGIVTRCPLVLRLRKSDQRRVYRLHDDNHANKKELLDEAQLNIPRYIEEETKKLAGDNKNVVKNIIELQVEDPEVRDLTVVDLPGIAHNPIADQPEDIYEQTTNLIREFITQEGSVILCVFPANVDIATVQSFKLAREFDPTGKRTIGVITKSDLAPDQDTLVQQLLMDRKDVLHLKLGFVAVRNRTAKENISLQEAHANERKFFEQHPASFAAGWECVGINALIDRLATVYSERVKEMFPKLRSDIQARLKDVKQQLSNLPPHLQTPIERVVVYNEIVDLYVDKVVKATLTAPNDARQGTMTHILHQKFEAYRLVLRKQRGNLFSPAYCSRVEEEMRGYAGDQLPNFLSSAILKKFVSGNLDQLWNETEKLINDCFRTTMIQVRKAEDAACTGNPLLAKLIPLFRDACSSYVKEKKNKVHEQLKELVLLDQYEPYTINTSYMYIFEKYKGPPPNISLSFGAAVSSTVTSPDDYGDEDDVFSYKLGSSDAQAIKQMLLSLYSYWKLLTKRFIDYVTLSLRAGCVFAMCPAVQQRLRRIPVDHPDWVDRYLADDDFIRNRRKQCQKTEEVLEKVYKILHQDETTFTDDIFSDFILIQSDSTDIPQAVETKATSITASDTTDNSVKPSTTISPSSSIQPNTGSSFSFAAPATSAFFDFGSSAASTTSPFSPVIKRK
jgi:interferon-induced GTP-binding protein Mx1